MAGSRVRWYTVRTLNPVFCCYGFRWPSGTSKSCRPDDALTGTAEKGGRLSEALVTRQAVRGRVRTHHQRSCHHHITTLTDERMRTCQAALGTASRRFCSRRRSWDVGSPLLHLVVPAPAPQLYRLTSALGLVATVWTALPGTRALDVTRQHRVLRRVHAVDLGVPALPLCHCTLQPAAPQVHHMLLHAHLHHGLPSCSPPRLDSCSIA